MKADKPQHFREIWGDRGPGTERPQKLGHLSRKSRFMHSTHTPQGGIITFPLTGRDAGDTDEACCYLWVR